MRPSPFALALLLSCLALAAPDARAQRSGFGIGGQIGEPTGLSMRIGAGRGAIDLQAGWNFSNDFIFAQGHYLLANSRLGVQGADVRGFYGPGVFVATHAGNDNVDGNTALGVSLNAGISAFFNALEIYGQVTPRLQLVDETDFGVGGGLGARIYF